MFLLKKKSFEFISNLSGIDTKYMLSMNFCDENDSILLITKEKIT